MTINLDKLAADVAKILGWYTLLSNDGYPSAAMFQRPPTGHSEHDSWTPKVYFRLNWQKTRIEISGGWPVGPQGVEAPRSSEDIPSVTVATTRDAAAVAKDIQRRFLEPYLTLHAKCLERVKSALEYRNAGKTNANALADAIGESKVHSNGDRHSFWIDGGDGAWHADVDVSGDSTSVNIRSLTINEARQVLFVLKKLRK